MAPETSILEKNDLTVKTSMGIDLDTIYNAPERERVMVIDDEPDTVHLLKELLRLSGFDVMGAYGCGEALRKCAEWPPDVILLDLMMPGTDGWDTYKSLREISNSPVIFVSALSNKDTVVKGLQTGVDDYVTKPFYNAEVIARIKNVLRRSAERAPLKRLYFPSVRLSIDLEAKEVRIQNQLMHLTSKEFEILILLAKKANTTVTHQMIAQTVWGEDGLKVRQRIKYLVYLLRRKLEIDPSIVPLIVNIEGTGYKLRTESS